MKVQPFPGLRTFPSFHCITGVLRCSPCARFPAEAAGIPWSDEQQQPAGELQQIGARWQAVALLFSGAYAAGACSSGICAESGARMMEISDLEEVFRRWFCQIVDRNRPVRGSKTLFQ